MELRRAFHCHLHVCDMISVGCSVRGSSVSLCGVPRTSRKPKIEGVSQQEWQPGPVAESGTDGGGGTTQPTEGIFRITSCAVVKKSEKTPPCQCSSK